MRKAVLVCVAVVAAALLYWWFYAAIWMTYPRVRWSYDHWVVRHFGDALDHRMKELSDNGAVNCGRARMDGMSKTENVTDCVLDASRASRAFRARYDWPPEPIGVEHSYALVTTRDGRAFALFFWGTPSQMYLGGRYNQRVEMRSCPQPTRVRVEYTMATCFPPKGGEGD